MQVERRLRGNKIEVERKGYKEGPENKKSDEPLHLCISSKNAEEMKKVCLLVDELLNKINNEYKDYCKKNNVMPVKDKTFFIFSLNFKNSYLCLNDNK